MVTSLGATPRMVMSNKPCGGSSKPNCMQIKNMMPNHTGSTPNCWMMGMKMGKVMSIMLTWSTNTPKKIKISSMPTMTALVDKLEPVMT